MKFFLRKKNNPSTKKLWFTLVEIIVAIAISSILFIFLFNFMVDALNEIKVSKDKSKFFSNFAGFQLKMKNISEVFPKYAVLIDNNYGSWSDIVLFKNRKENKAIALWIVDVDKMKFDKDYNIYKQKVIWIIELSKNQLTELWSDANKIYDYKVFKDKLFEDIFAKDLQAQLYNNFKILDLEMLLIPSYKPSLDWENWNNLKKSDLFKIVLDF